MPASTPEEVQRLFAEAFDAGDVDAAIELYEPNATLVIQPGEEPVRGAEAIREALNGFLSMFQGKPKFDLEYGKAFEAGDDLALLVSRWTLAGTGHDGGAVEMASQTADVVRQKPDGSWRIVIDNPYGDAALA